MINQPPIINIFEKAAIKASKYLKRDFGEIEKLQVSKKGPLDFVTNSDLKSEKIIIEELCKGRPDFSIISEENGVKKNKDNKVIEGNPDKIKFVTDNWKFTKNINNKSPNWYLSEIISK